MKLIGNKEFYKKLLVIMLPIVIQNLITNFVSLLDNIMVGQTGTDQMNAVSVCNQLFFVFNLCLWGAVSGAAIFTSQYYGKGDNKGVRDTFRAKIVMVFIVSVVACLIFWFFGGNLISKFLHETNDVGNAEETLRYAIKYMRIMLIGVIPLALNFAYGNTLRGIGQTRIPMVAGVMAVGVNLVLNYVLIFGHFGAPRMGVAGAAIATVISRYLETGFMMFYTHTHKSKCQFIIDAYKTLRIPNQLLRQILIKGLPLAVNETMWSLGLTLMNQCYSIRGLDVVAALNITSTIVNLFNVVMFAVGDSISIIIGQLLGANKMDEAKDTANKLIFFSVSCCAVLGLILASTRHLFPAIYNTEETVKLLSSKFILVSACAMPVCAAMHACYFTIRTGGRTIITFLFDSVFICCVSFPVAYCLVHFSAWYIVFIYLTVQALDILKVAIGLTLVKKGIWVNNLVAD